MNILQLRFSSCLVPNRDDRSRPLPAPRDASHPTERASFGARALDSVRAESRGAASGRIMSSTAAPTEPGGAAPNPTSSSDGPSGDDSTNNADVDPHAAPPPLASSPSPHLAAIAASWSAAEDWLVSRPLRAWRVCHALSCLAMACARVNLASAVYLSLFVAQCSLGAGGRVGLYRGTSRRLWVSRTDRYRAWLTQRRLLALTALAAAANALAQRYAPGAALAAGAAQYRVRDPRTGIVHTAAGTGNGYRPPGGDIYFKRDQRESVNFGREPLQPGEAMVDAPATSEARRLISMA